MTLVDVASLISGFAQPPPRQLPPANPPARPRTPCKPWRGNNPLHVHATVQGLSASSASHMKPQLAPDRHAPPLAPAPRRDGCIPHAFGAFFLPSFPFHWQWCLIRRPPRREGGAFQIRWRLSYLWQGEPQSETSSSGSVTAGSVRKIGAKARENVELAQSSSHLN